MCRSSVDNSDGSYSANYLITQAGKYRVRIEIGGTLGARSPYVLNVNTEVADRSLTYAYGQFVGIKTGFTSELYVQTRDRYGNHIRADAATFPPGAVNGGDQGISFELCKTVLTLNEGACGGGDQYTSVGITYTYAVGPDGTTTNPVSGDPYHGLYQVIFFPFDPEPVIPRVRHGDLKVEGEGGEEGGDESLGSVVPCYFDTSGITSVHAEMDPGAVEANKCAELATSAAAASRRRGPTQKQPPLIQMRRRGGGGEERGRSGGRSAGGAAGCEADRGGYEPVHSESDFVLRYVEGGGVENAPGWVAQATRGAGGVGLPAKVHILAGNGNHSPAGGADAGFGSAEIVSPELSVRDGQLPHHSLRRAPAQAVYGNKVTIESTFSPPSTKLLERWMQFAPFVCAGIAMFIALCAVVSEAWRKRQMRNITQLMQAATEDAAKEVEQEQASTSAQAPADRALDVSGLLVHSTMPHVPDVQTERLTESADAVILNAMLADGLLTNEQHQNCLQLASQKDPRVEGALQYHHRNRMRTALLLSKATNNDPTETVTRGLVESHEQFPYRAAGGDGTALGTTHEELIT
jgi:hypothetical protein